MVPEVKRMVRNNRSELATRRLTIAAPTPIGVRFSVKIESFVSVTSSSSVCDAVAWNDAAIPINSCLLQSVRQRSLLSHAASCKQRAPDNKRLSRLLCE